MCAHMRVYTSVLRGWEREEKEQGQPGDLQTPDNARLYNQPQMQFLFMAEDTVHIGEGSARLVWSSASCHQPIPLYEEDPSTSLLRCQGCKKCRGKIKKMKRVVRDFRCGRQLIYGTRSWLKKAVGCGHWWLKLSDSVCVATHHRKISICLRLHL